MTPIMSLHASNAASFRPNPQSLLLSVNSRSKLLSPTPYLMYMSATGQTDGVGGIAGGGSKGGEGKGGGGEGGGVDGERHVPQ